MSLINASWRSRLKGLQRRIHGSDLLGDGFLIRLQSFDAGQLIIDVTLALRQFLEGRLRCSSTLAFGATTGEVHSGLPRGRERTTVVRQSSSR